MTAGRHARDSRRTTKGPIAVHSLDPVRFRATKGATMRRKTDMFKDFTNGDAMSFLPGEGEQEATTNAAQMRERLATVEEQLRSQFTSLAAYAQISQQSVATARAESRADLDREKATII